MSATLIFSPCRPYPQAWSLVSAILGWTESWGQPGQRLWSKPLMNFPTKPQVEGQSMAESYWFLSCGKTFKRGKDYIFFPLNRINQKKCRKFGLTEQRRVSRWCQRCRQRCWASVCYLPTTHAWVSGVYVKIWGSREGGNPPYPPPTASTQTDKLQTHRHSRKQIAVQMYGICQKHKTTHVKLGTCIAKRAVAAIPIQLCME